MSSNDNEKLQLALRGLMKEQLSISSWNVHGLGDKIDDPFFLNNIKSDINILLETWKGECEEFKVKGFNLISKCRKKKKGSRRYSGGIIIYIRKEYMKGISYLKDASLSENRLWLKVDKYFFGLSDDIYICASYIPPVSSTHFENDFIMLDHELSTLSNRGKILVIGDLNSRTGELPDYIKNDSLQINNFDGSDLLPPDYAIDIENKRINQDKVLNTHGKNLLDLCLSSGLRIVNGRLLGDSLGYYTYMSKNGFSTVDYALVSESLLSSVQYFKTNDFTYLSDHAKIDLFLKCSINENAEFKLDNNKWKSINTYKWTEQSKNLVINALSTDYIREEIISLEILDINKTQDGVDEAVEKLTDILQNISEMACKKFFWK
ncbi:unnamed protein product [Mytilus edulis]|uniref:Endonuclease/exonuclease/phosphatase domain-containing protein n=1 Tax=Mytilus edulis TaxID=6550 RepID=A0A8S3PYZ4_MYTED|nr:unnamed protein product [Mytilus edulis]